MTERLFRLLTGSCIIMALYFDLRNLMVGLIALLLFEGLTNWRVPLLISRLRYGAGTAMARDETPWPVQARFNIGFDAERAWRFTVAVLLFFTYLLFYPQAWFMPWFMGFAIFGAGLSGICPMLISLKLIGFK
ncbi:MAG: hypothetical protein ACYC7I_09810 [Gammaproteobacteria bacterium]